MSAHALTDIELQTIAQKATEAKAKAYCMSLSSPRDHPPKKKEEKADLVQARIQSSVSVPA
jgi:hypothetical protein